MFVSLALIFLGGLAAKVLAQRLHLPGLFGMLLWGVAIGPSALGLLDADFMTLAADLRRFALIVILLRAGLNLDTAGLKKVGRPAALLSFVPATFEILGVLLLAPSIFDLNLAEAALLGTVLAAVSPAVVVPKMIDLQQEKLGTKEGVPQLILAGASLDDIYVLVLFQSFLKLVRGEGFRVLDLLQIPTSIILGLGGGLVLGYVLTEILKRVPTAHATIVVLLLGLSFLLVTLEDWITGPVAFSGLLAIMMLGLMVQRKLPRETLDLRVAMSSLWTGAEILLFVLVGATVDYRVALSAAPQALLLIMGALAVRLIGVALALFKTSLSLKERIFIMLAYMPKATVQAAIGSLPLSLGLRSGPVILLVAVWAILLTAPLGAFAIDHSKRALLRQEE